MIIDTHSHCYWDTLLPRIDEVVANMHQNTVTHAVQIGCDITSSEAAISLARRFPGVFFATVGHHPETAQDNYELRITNHEWGDVVWKEQILRASGWDTWEDECMLVSFEKLIQNNRDVVVAIGECGFDYHYLDGTDGGKNVFDRKNPSPKALEQIQNQKDWWLAQWSLAQKYHLPLVIHTRDARDETLDFMREHSINRCVMHCFSEDWDFARELLDFSDEIYFSFSGILTYKKSEKIQEAAQKIPLHRILVETDAPFLAPQPVRGTVNEPANTRYVLEKLIELRTESAETIEVQVYENSRRFYSI